MLTPCWNLLLTLLFHPCLCQPPGHHDLDVPLQYYDDNVIDLLEALNVTRSIKGVTKSKGREPGSPAWKFRQRVPHLTLPWDYSVYLLSSTQGSLGLHLVAKQAKNNQGTLLTFLSPAAMKRDGRPLLRLTSDTRSDQLRLEYRTPQGMEPASLLLPGGSPFSGSRWVRLALNLDIHKVTLFQDCEEPVVFGQDGEEEMLGLILPLDLEISFASSPGDKASKFLGYWQTAEISPNGFSRRPWHCDNRADSLPLPYSLSEERHMEEDETQPEPGPPQLHALSDTRHYQQQQSEAPPPLLNQGERLQRLDEALRGLASMLEMVKVQNADLLTRVKALESCECRRPACSWEGSEYRDSDTWKMDACNICVCVAGSVTCSLRKDRPQCPGCSHEGRSYSNGETFSGGSCTSCVCQNGAVSCTQKECLPVTCTQKECLPVTCRDPVTPRNECCPRCVTGCSDGHREGAAWRKDPCTSCTCQNGTVQCERESCPDLTCAKRHTLTGQCCATCQQVCELDGRPLSQGQNVTSADGCRHCACQDGELRCTPAMHCPNTCTHGVRRGSCCPDCSACDLHGDIISNGVTFQGNGDPCDSCVCRDGSVLCVRVSCPKLSCALQEEVPGECCRRCQGE
ncbi:kielin/chordin-like protein [Ascaphus truei]|uniref:kielin/chordin-like protein n=1 Tax=Ascaphus truei TaxID=8439 RepID=UPI003F5A2A54